MSTDLFRLDDGVAVVSGATGWLGTPMVGALAEAGYIATSRGQITILDRDGIEKRVGESYGIPEANYRDLVGD